ncbi:hypothetical protein [Thalassobacillus sp. CUG 92003]|uniref:hypothetical protein n=1 Tax=Thalassobacillus sp. CUG 92003 TaxID=2736641 RepID=UPI0015E79CF5|nr:hypothetical protein [Thalassobacillus sp. CUG 92003]
MCVVFTGCSAGDSPDSTAQDQNITTIETVLHQQFTGPDQTLMDLLDDPANSTIIGNGETTTPDAPTQLDVYLEEKYRPYFSERMYEEFIGTYALEYHTSPSNNGYQLDVETTKIEDVATTEGAYDFTVNVLYKKKGGEERHANVTGRMNINKESTITKYRLMDDDGLSKSLTSSH